jgi:hypothetical protein
MGDTIDDIVDNMMDMATVSTILITQTDKRVKHFHKKLIFKTLTDEHVLRLLFLQKIKKAKDLNDSIKIYIDDIELDDMKLHLKLKNILKYEADTYNIKIIDINDSVDVEEIEFYNRIICSRQ